MMLLTETFTLSLQKQLLRFGTILPTGQDTVGVKIVVVATDECESHTRGFPETADESTAGVL